MALRPSGACVPTLSSVSFSESVLPVGKREGAATVAPAGGLTPFSTPCSLALLTLKGIADVIDCVCCARRSAASVVATWGVEDGALSVLRAAAFGPVSPAALAPARLGLLSVALGLVGMLGSLVVEAKLMAGAVPRQWHHGSR